MNGAAENGLDLNQSMDHEDINSILRNAETWIPSVSVKFSLEFLRKNGTQPIPGNGVGLFICNNIVERHGGKIVVESNGVNEGNSVRIILPQKAVV